VIATVISFVGLKTFLVIQMPIVALAASAGVWLFYIQHQFEDTLWADGGSWNIHEAALRGSSHYDLPGILRWFTANIGVHHVHHLCSRIPFYRLRQVLRSHPELTPMGRLTLSESFRCVRLVLWDEQRKKLVSFGELRCGQQI
jgi:acyl-lipid omega-6 desaturase (Delta-12 desaturase)